MGTFSIQRALHLNKRRFVKALQKTLSPNRYSGLDRWLVKGVKTRLGTAMSVWLYDMDVWQLTICVILGYMAAGLVFTILLYPAYLLDPEHSFAGDSPEELGAFTAVFCMSLSALSQTAVDLSDLAPTSGYTICVVVIAHFVGVLMGAVLLGVLINKASIPSARVVFSDVCLLTSRNGEPVLILRIGNTRGNFLLNPEIRVGYLKIEATLEGENVMTMTRMELNEPPAMAPSINVTCKITPDSPLWGKTYHDLEAEGAAIYVALAATDNQHFQEVFARRFYLVQDIRFNCRFKDIMRTTPTGDRLVDFRGFNSVLQNTIMPVSFGLTFEETVAVNGPLVEAAPENSSVSKASKPAMPTKQQKPKKEKKDKKTKQQDGSKSKVKKAHKHKHKGTEDDSELLSGIKSDTVQASGSPRVEDIQVADATSTPTSADIHPSKRTVHQRVLHKAIEDSHNTAMHGAQAQAYMEEPTGNGREFVSEYAKNLIKNPEKQVFVQKVFPMDYGSAELPEGPGAEGSDPQASEEQCSTVDTVKCTLKTLSTAITAFSSIRRPSAQGITEASTSGSGCDNGSGAGAFSMESIEESDNLFDTDASQAKAHGYVRKMKDTEKLMEEAAARRDAVVRQRSSGRFSEDSIPKEALAEYAGDKEDEEPVSARGSRHLWRQTAERVQAEAARSDRQTPQSSFGPPKIPEALSMELPDDSHAAFTDSANMHARYASQPTPPQPTAAAPPSAMHDAHDKCTDSAKFAPRISQRTRAEALSSQQQEVNVVNVQMGMKKGAGIDPEEMEERAKASADEKRWAPHLQEDPIYESSEENDEIGGPAKMEGASNESSDTEDPENVLDPSAAATHGQRATPIAAHLRSYRPPTGGTSAPLCAEGQGSAENDDGDSSSESDSSSDSESSSGSDDDPPAADAAAEAPRLPAALAAAGAAATGGGAAASAPAARAALRAVAAAAAASPPAAPGAAAAPPRPTADGAAGGGVAGAAKALLVARRWKRQALSRPTVATVPEDRALTASSSSISTDSVDGGGGEGGSNPSEAVWSTLLARTNGDLGGRGLLHSASLASHASSDSNEGEDSKTE